MSNTDHIPQKFLVQSHFSDGRLCWWNGRNEWVADREKAKEYTSLGFATRAVTLYGGEVVRLYNPDHFDFVVDGGMVHQNGLRFCPDFLTIEMSNDKAMELIEALAYKLRRGQHIKITWGGEMTRRAKDTDDA